MVGLAFLTPVWVVRLAMGWKHSTSGNGDDEANLVRVSEADVRPRRMTVQLKFLIVACCALVQLLLLASSRCCASSFAACAVHAARLGGLSVCMALLMAPGASRRKASEIDLLALPVWRGREQCSRPPRWTMTAQRQVDYGRPCISDSGVGGSSGHGVEA